MVFQYQLSSEFKILLMREIILSAGCVVSRVGRVGTMTVITGQCAMVITPRQLSAFPTVNTQTHREYRPRNH